MFIPNFEKFFFLGPGEGVGGADIQPICGRLAGEKLRD